ncbi:hypothetical protein [Dinoroseobacter sp. S375]|uniref:hypothetical protein n=1 Tax=Dinoroseobacter sp. S375 TaxID=3415136 RepID=UPI003C7AF5B9
MDHDITAGTDRAVSVSKIDTEDLEPLPRAVVVEQLGNLRTGRLDLDSLYGGAVLRLGTTTKIPEQTTPYSSTETGCKRLDIAFLLSFVFVPRFQLISQRRHSKAGHTVHWNLPASLGISKPQLHFVPRRIQSEGGLTCRGKAGRLGPCKTVLSFHSYNSTFRVAAPCFRGTTTPITSGGRCW